jgi:hypothetical protein
MKRLQVHGCELLIQSQTAAVLAAPAAVFVGHTTFAETN